jgi:uncharacterized protein YjbJ (UPF0337 family)
MKWSIIEGSWKQYRGAVKQRWTKLDDVHLDSTAGRHERLSALIQEEYGVSRSEADEQLEAWLDIQAAPAPAPAP